MKRAEPRTVITVTLASAALLLTGCGSTTHGIPIAPPVTPSTSLGVPSSATPPGSSSPPTSPTRSTASAPPTGKNAVDVLAQMTEAQRVGQLFMVDCPTTGGIPNATLAAIQTYHVGSVILDGTTTAGAAAIRSLTAQLELANPSVAKLFLATDQEGGEVQRLQGPGFSSVPSAVDQGQLSPATLKADEHLWGTQLRAAGINVDLAPVVDTVPANSAGNPPIGDLDREFGHDPATVSSHGVAAVQGLALAGVDATIKHFPGLGRTAGNTDLSAGVTDTVTTRHDAYLAPFAAAIAVGTPFVMMSTAIYTRIDPARPAAFSPTIISDMLRGDLGFGGVVISDDLGAARQVTGYSVGGRAVAFIAAGGDIVLTVDAGQTAEMTAAVLARTRTDPAFKAQVDAAALTVLQAKQARGLLD